MKAFVWILSLGPILSAHSSAEDPATQRWISSAGSVRFFSRRPDHNAAALFADGEAKESWVKTVGAGLSF